MCYALRRFLVRLFSVSLAVTFCLALAGAAEKDNTAALASPPARSDAAKVPSLVGFSAKKAKAVIQAAGLVSKFQLGPAPDSQDKALTVYQQKPPTGAPLANGEPVYLTLYSEYRGRSPSSPVAAAHVRLTQVVAVPLLDLSEEIVEPRSGSLYLAVTDLSQRAGALTLDVRRSLQRIPSPPGLLGTQWRLNWESRLKKVGPDVVIYEDAQAVRFSLDKATQHHRSAGGDDLTLAADRAVRARPNGTRETFDQQGRLIERDERNGNKFTLTYDAQGRLARIDAPYDNFLLFTTNKQGRLTKVESSTGANVIYSYDGKQADAAQPDAALPVTYAYDAAGMLTSIEHPQLGATKFSYSVQGRISKRSWADGTSEQYAYDDATRTLRYIDPLGHNTTTTWREDYRQAETTDPLGRITVTEYDEAGRTTAVTGPTGQTARMAYDALSRIIEIQSPATGTTKFEYRGDSRLPATIVGPGENRQSLEYNNHGDLVRATNALDPAQNAELEYYPDGQLKSLKMGTGQKQSYTYDAAGRRDSVIDAAGNKWRYEYDGRGNLIREIDPLDGVTTRSYDAHGRPVSLTDPSGATTRLNYEQRGRFSIVTATDPRDGVTRMVYDQRGRVVDVHDPAKRATRYNYDAGGRLVSVIDPAGQNQKYEYDTIGNLVGETNPLGAVTKCAYSALGTISSIANATGAVNHFEYSPAGSLTKQIDEAGLATTFEYDGQNRPVGETAASGRTTQYEYTPAGRLAKLIPPSGPEFSYRYDNFGNLASELRGDQPLAKYEYDALGRRTKVRHASGLEITRSYDALGNLLAWQDNQGGGEKAAYDAIGRLTSVTDASGAITTRTYDPSGNLLQIMDPRKHAKTFKYDAADQLVEVAEPTGDRAHYEYDSLGRVAAVQHPSGGTSSYEYDPLGNLTETVNPVGGKTQSTYDSSGRLLSTTDAKGQTTKFAFDAADRLVEKVFADNKTVRYTYDRLNRLAKIDDGTFPVLYNYDENNNVSRVQYPAIKRTLSYEYNDAGLKTKFVDSEGRAVHYEYDAYDRLSAIKPDKNQAIVITYDPKGRATSIAYPNGVKGAWEYDGNDRSRKLTYINAAKKNIAGWTYAYDAGGNLTEMVETGGRTIRYGYDPSGQIIEEALDGAPQGTVRFSYLPGGNRETIEASGNKTKCRYDAADRLLAAGEETFGYDSNGNLIERKGPQGTTRYDYDVQDRLVKVVLPDGKDVSYGYAPTGDRTWRRDAAGLTWFVTDGVDLAAELDQDLKAKATYLHGPGIDRPLMMTRGGQTYFFHAQRLGSISRVTDLHGEVAASYDYDAFGQIRAKQGQLEAPFHYAAREFDSATGLYYYRARYYDAHIARFLSTDRAAPDLVNLLDLNSYTYARNAPTRFKDPAGTSAVPAEPEVQWAQKVIADTKNRGTSNLSQAEHARYRQAEQVNAEWVKNQAANKARPANTARIPLNIPAGIHLDNKGRVAVPNVSAKGAVKTAAKSIGLLGAINFVARVVEGKNNGETIAEAVDNATDETIVGTVVGTGIGTFVTVGNGVIGGMVGSGVGRILGGQKGATKGWAAGTAFGSGVTGGVLILVGITKSGERIIMALSGGTGNLTPKVKPKDPKDSTDSTDPPPDSPEKPPNPQDDSDKPIDLPVDPDNTVDVPDHPQTPAALTGELGDDSIELPQPGASETLGAVIDSPESILGPPPDPDPNAQWPICPLCGKRHDPNE